MKFWWRQCQFDSMKKCTRSGFENSYELSIRMVVPKRKWDWRKFDWILTDEFEECLERTFLGSGTVWHDIKTFERPPSDVEGSLCQMMTWALFYEKVDS